MFLFSIRLIFVCFVFRSFLSSAFVLFRFLSSCLCCSSFVLFSYLCFYSQFITYFCFSFSVFSFSFHLFMISFLAILLSYLCFYSLITWYPVFLFLFPFTLHFLYCFHSVFWVTKFKLHPLRSSKRENITFPGAHWLIWWSGKMENVNQMNRKRGNTKFASKCSSMAFWGWRRGVAYCRSSENTRKV